MNLDPSVRRAPVLDHRGLDLAAVRRVRYILEQSFRYEYDAPVESLRQRLVIVPPARHGNQYLRAHRLEVTGAKARCRVRRDAAGNVVAWLRAEYVPAAIEFRLTAVLERVRDDGPAVLPAAMLHSPRLLRPTRLTAPDERLRAMAADLAGSPDSEELAQRVCAAVSSAIAYEYGVTTVSTTAAEALACGRGVCQDSAHVMLALCRLLGQPARYVSGHLLGQGGTHAWVEVIVPRAGQAEAIAFDPCHGRRTDSGYVTVATGRDYADVAPTSGSYVGASAGRLTAGRRVGVLSAA
ncbi:MAG TPA: transglutaminase family protein [Streptosporangiaceae bacterium]|nr:transglutaminase family protein [Streptosporangiaceae bacterium]